MWTSNFLNDFRAANPATDTIECEIEKEGILTRVDPNQITQVLDNLCQNAFRYSGAAGSHRTIYLKLYEDSSSQLPTIEVIDHGPGVAAEHVGHIFEPFYTTEASGTGSAGVSDSHPYRQLHAYYLRPPQTTGMIDQVTRLKARSTQG